MIQNKSRQICPRKLAVNKRTIFILSWGKSCQRLEFLVGKEIVRHVKNKSTGFSEFKAPPHPLNCKA